MSRYRFNPPPNWPPLPTQNWKPPKGWTPPSEWGPVPDGWQLWVPVKRSVWAHPGMITGYVVIGVILVLMSSALDSGTSEPSADPKPAATATKTKEKPPKVSKSKKPMAQLRGNITDALGEGNREDVDRLGEVSKTDGVIVVKWAIDDNLTENMIKTGVRMDVQDILKAVKDTSDVPYKEVMVVGSFSMQDEYGNVSEDPVLRLGFSRSVISKIDFDNVDPDNLPGLADGVAFVHPEFR